MDGKPQAPGTVSVNVSTLAGQLAKQVRLRTMSVRSKQHFRHVRFSSSSASSLATECQVDCELKRSDVTLQAPSAAATEPSAPKALPPVECIGSNVESTDHQYIEVSKAADSDVHTRKRQHSLGSDAPRNKQSCERRTDDMLTQRPSTPHPAAAVDARDEPKAARLTDVVRWLFEETRRQGIAFLNANTEELAAQLIHKMRSAEPNASVEAGQSELTLESVALGLIGDIARDLGGPLLALPAEHSLTARQSVAVATTSPTRAVGPTGRPVQSIAGPDGCLDEVAQPLLSSDNSRNRHHDTCGDRTHMPFATSNERGWAKLRRVIELLLLGLDYEIARAYADDIIICGRDKDQCVERLTGAVERLEAATHQFTPIGDVPAVSKAPPPGYVVSADGVRCDPQQVEQIRNWPTPQTARQVRQFLGVVNYYRRFVPNYAAVAKPLHAVSRRRSNFEWTDECEQAFRTLRAIMAANPVLARPGTEELLTLDTDASPFTISGVLSQRQRDGGDAAEATERVIAYASRTLSEAEQRYSSRQRELFAVITFVEHFYAYLHNRDFVIRLNHTSLRNIKGPRDLEKQLEDWIKDLESKRKNPSHDEDQRIGADSSARGKCEADSTIEGYPPYQGKRSETTPLATGNGDSSLADESESQAITANRPPVEPIGSPIEPAGRQNEAHESVHMTSSHEQCAQKHVKAHHILHKERVSRPEADQAWIFQRSRTYKAPAGDAAAQTDARVTQEMCVDTADLPTSIDVAIDPHNDVVSTSTAASATAVAGDCDASGVSSTHSCPTCNCESVPQAVLDVVYDQRQL